MRYERITMHHCLRIKSLAGAFLAAIVTALFCLLSPQAQAQSSNLIFNCRGNETFQARLLSVRDSEIVVYSGVASGRAMLMDTTQMRVVPFRSVRYVTWDNPAKKGDFGTGALIGGSLGGLIGIVVGAAVAEDQKRKTDYSLVTIATGSATTATMLAYGGLGMLIGGLIGGIISSSDPDPEVIYAAHGPRDALRSHAIITGEEPEQIHLLH